MKDLIGILVGGVLLGIAVSHGEPSTGQLLVIFGFSWLVHKAVTS